MDLQARGYALESWHHFCAESFRHVSELFGVVKELKPMSASEEREMMELQAQVEENGLTGKAPCCKWRC